MKFNIKNTKVTIRSCNSSYSYFLLPTIVFEDWCYGYDIFFKWLTFGIYIELDNAEE